MTVRDVVKKCAVGTVLYRYTMGVSRLKLIAVHKKSHSALFEDSMNMPYLCHDYYDGFFLTEQEAVSFRKECITAQIDRLKKELAALERK